MTDFRRWILALTVLAFCVVGANAQVTGVGGGSVPTCTTINGAGTPNLRQEGITELAGDIVIQCTGGNLPAPGTAIPQANITVFFNTQVTSRLLGTGSVTNASEAMLLVDEPNSGLGGYGPTVPMTICGTPATGCQAWMGNSTVAGGTGVPVASNPNSGTPPVFNPTALAPAANIYQGVVNPDGKSITFFGVPVEAPGTSGTREFRITNVRVNANNVPGGSSNINPGSVLGLISFSNSVVTLTQPQVTIGLVTPGLTASLIKPASTSTIGSSGTAFNQCSSTTGGGAGTIIGNLRYQANFGTAFKTRVVAANGVSGQDPNVNQSNPTSANNGASESGLVMNGVGGTKLFNGVNGTSVAGLADYGTRFRAVFNNIPSGVSIFVSTNNVGPGNQTAVTSASPTFAQLVVSDTAPENGAAPPTLAATGSNGSGNFVSLQIINGSATANWEVVNSVTTTNQAFEFAAYISYSGGVPAAGSQIVVSQSYSPIGSTSGTVLASAGANIPRFVDPGTYDNKVFASINFCTTNLLFPFVVSNGVFDTGLAISNTSLDPFGTGTQTGACTLNWYTSGGVAAAATNTPITATSVGVVTPGTTWASTASQTLPTASATSFAGYVIAQCNFQYAHGYAAITDIGTRNLMTSYLALVMNGGRVGAATETLAH